MNCLTSSMFILSFSVVANYIARLFKDRDVMSSIAKVVLLELNCDVSLKSWVLILQHYKIRERVFLMGVGENDEERKTRIKRLLNYYFILYYYLEKNISMVNVIIYFLH